MNFEKITWIKRYEVDTLQIYFAASLEIQEEFLRYGFPVPRSRDSLVKMPIPIIYANFRGWLKPSKPITIERLIPQEWLDLEFKDLGWRKTYRDGKEAYEIPPEEVYVNIGVMDNIVVFDLDVRGYHLERASIRGVNPEKWNNWAMFYISLEYIDDITAKLSTFVEKLMEVKGQKPLSALYKPEKEVLQNGKEVTYYVRVPIVDFSLCLGCFELVQRYLRVKAIECCRQGIVRDSNICKNPDKVSLVMNLRLRYDSSIDTFAKVGIAKISGKHPQIMVKIASTSPKTIRGLLKQIIEGKARGKLEYCDHRVKKQWIALNLVEFYRALITTRNYVSKLPKD